MRIEDRSRRADELAADEEQQRKEKKKEEEEKEERERRRRRRRRRRWTFIPSLISCSARLHRFPISMG